MELDSEEVFLRRMLKEVVFLKCFFSSENSLEAAFERQLDVSNMCNEMRVISGLLETSCLADCR